MITLSLASPAVRHVTGLVLCLAAAIMVTPFCPRSRNLFSPAWLLYYLGCFVFGALIGAGLGLGL